MAPEPTIVIFDTNPSSGNLLAGKDLLQSWKHGPNKMKSFSRRGRPRKSLDIQSSQVTNAGHAVRVIRKPQLKGSSPPVYEFVACKDPSGSADATARKTIRSHVMRQHHRQKEDLSSSTYLERNTSILSSGQYKSTHNEREYVDGNPKAGGPVETGELATFDPFDCLPLRIQPYMLEILGKYTTCSYERVYSIEKYTDYNPMRDCFLPMAFQDLALLHAILFSSVCLKTLAPKYREVPKAVIHLRECIRLVNERLRSPSLVIDDSTILIVVMVAYSEKLTGHHTNWRVHMHGLRQLVRLRGGLKNLRSNWALHSLILRTDLYGSIDAISEPYFDVDVTLVIPETQSTYFSKGFRNINDLYLLGNDFNSILRKVEDATIALNRIHVGDMTVNPFDLRDELTSTQYVLLRLECSRHNVHESDAEHLCRLGLLLYLVTILNDLLPGASTCDMLATRLRAELDSMSEERITPEFRWWLVLLVGGIAADDANKAWAKRAFEEIISHPSVTYRRENAKAVLTKFFWVEKIHGEKFNKLWTEALVIGDKAPRKIVESENRPSRRAHQLVEARRCSDYGTWLGSLK